MSDIYYHGPVVVFDLDDTLYKERDFVFSALKAVSEALSCPDMRDSLERAFLNGLNPISEALRLSPDSMTESELVEVYRFHRPELTLPDESRRVLDDLISHGIRLALVTDGRSRTQRAKIEALGLTRYFNPEMIFISEEAGADKTSPVSFRRIVRNWPEAKKFCYVGDNPAKDFKVPNVLGWTSIMLRDTDGCNIHPQTGDFPALYRPGVEIDSLQDLSEIIL